MKMRTLAVCMCLISATVLAKPKGEDEEASETSPLEPKKPEVQLLRFPVNAAFGTVYTRDTGEVGWQDWKPKAKAQGDIEVPLQKEIRLDLSSRAALHMAPIELLKDVRFQALNAAGRPVSDLSLKFLRDLKSLEVLNLRGSQVSSDGLVHLKKLENMMTLFLDDTFVVDAGLENLSGMKNLTHLGLSKGSGLRGEKARARLQGEGLEAVGRLFTLQFLDLAGNDIQDEHLEHLERVRLLYHLDLSRTKVTGSGLVHLQKSMRLRDLFLQGTHMRDANVKHLLPMTGLMKLNLNHTKITDKALVTLAELPSIAELHVRGAGPIGEEAFEALKSMKSLRLLEIDKGQLTYEQSQALKKLRADLRIDQVEVAPDANPDIKFSLPDESEAEEK